MKIVHTEDAPAALGPYSQALVVDGWVYTSGQVGIDPATGKLVDGGFEAQARQVLKNLDAVLTAAGAHFSDVVKTTIFVQDLNDFAKLNELYGAAMGAHRPARSTVEVARLPADALVEIDMVARLS